MNRSKYIDNIQLSEIIISFMHILSAGIQVER